MLPATAQIGDQTPPAQRRRYVWASKVLDQLRFIGWVTDDGKPDQRRFHAELRNAGCGVTRQAVDQWLSGETAPSPENQAYIAKVLRTAPHLLFPVEAA